VRWRIVLNSIGPRCGANGFDQKIREKRNTFQNTVFASMKNIVSTAGLAWMPAFIVSGSEMNRIPAVSWSRMKDSAVDAVPV